MTERILRLNLDTDAWSIPEVRAYRKAVGVNPDYASETIDRAFKAADAESREVYGEKVDEQGWSPPDGWVPLAVLNIDPDYLLGFYWITARREDHELEYEAFVESVRYGDLLESFWSTLKALAEKVEAAPLANRAERRKTGQRKATSSRSATSTAGPRAKSRPSPSASSVKPSPTETTG